MPLRDENELARGVLEASADVDAASFLLVGIPTGTAASSYTKCTSFEVEQRAARVLLASYHVSRKVLLSVVLVERGSLRIRSVLIVLEEFLATTSTVVLKEE